MNRHKKHLGLYILLAVIGIIFLIVVFGLFQTMGQVNSNTSNELVEVLVEQEVEQERIELTEEEQLEVLDDLAPEDPIDTPQERQEQIDLLEQLMNQ